MKRLLHGALALAAIAPVAQCGGGGQVAVAGLRVWLDASSDASFVIDTSGAQPTIVSWASVSPATETLVQATKAKQPKRNLTPGFNNVEFDGIDDVLARTIAGPVNINETTVFLVLVPLSNNGNAQYHAFMSWTRGNQNDYQAGLNIDMGQLATTDFTVFNIEGPKRTTPGGFDFMSTGIPFGTPTITQTNYWNTAIGASINGTAQQASLPVVNTNPMAFDTVRIGARYFNGIERGYCQVRVAELLVYDRPLNACEINSIGQYLAGRYGIVTSYLRPDLNADGVVNTSDLTLLLVGFGQAVQPLTGGDVNGDGVVNTNDLTLLLSVFGLSC